MSAWVLYPEGWRHRPWWKVAINTLLRVLQPHTARKLVVFTRCDDSTSPPTVLGYGFGRVRHL